MTRIPADRIRLAVAEHYRIPLHVLLSRKRSRDVARARMVAMYLCYEPSRLSYPRVGRIFERDHSTVIHACNEVRRLVREYQDYADDIEKLKFTLGATEI